MDTTANATALWPSRHSVWADAVRELEERFGVTDEEEHKRKLGCMVFIAWLNQRKLKAIAEFTHDERNEPPCFIVYQPCRELLFINSLVEPVLPRRQTDTNQMTKEVNETIERYVRLSIPLVVRRHTRRSEMKIMMDIGTVFKFIDAS